MRSRYGGEKSGVEHRTISRRTRHLAEKAVRSQLHVTARSNRSHQAQTRPVTNLPFLPALIYVCQMYQTKKKKYIHIFHSAVKRFPFALTGLGFMYKELSLVLSLFVSLMNIFLAFFLYCSFVVNLE